MSEEKTQDSKEQTFEEIANNAGSESPEVPATEAGHNADSSEESPATDDEHYEKETKEEIIDYSFQAELKRLFSRPLYIVAFVLGVLIILLLVVMSVQLREEQEEQALVGFVKVNRRLPPNYKGPISPEIKELLEIFKQQKKSLKEKLTLIKEDPREEKPVLGVKYPNPVTNKELIPILEEQKIGKVDLGGPEKTELMNLSGMDLTKLDYKFFYNFVGSDIRFCDFTAIKATGLQFRGASMQYAQLVDSSIPGSDFTRARLSYGNFYNADLEKSLMIGVVAQKAHFTQAKLIDSNFADAIIFDSDFEEVIADGMVTTNAHFEGVSFRDSSLINADFRNTVLRAVNFSNCNLQGADFENADLEGSNFEGANLEGVNFRNASVNQVSFKDVKNASHEQLNQSQFLPGASNIPDELVPKKYNWEDRITPPRRT